MKLAVVSSGYINQNIDTLKDLMSSRISPCIIQSFSSDNRALISELMSYSPDVLITEDMAGFDKTTLMDGIAYNLIYSQQIHFIYKSTLENPDNMQFIQKPCSLTMHFFCSSQEEKEKLLSINPDIPYIEVLDKENLCISDIVQVVMPFIKP